MTNPDDSRLIGTALDEDGDPIEVYTYDDGTIEIVEKAGGNFTAGDDVCTQLTPSEAAVFARLLLAACDVSE